MKEGEWWQQRRMILFKTRWSLGVNWCPSIPISTVARKVEMHGATAQGCEDSDSLAFGFQQLRNHTHRQPVVVSIIIP